MSESRQHLEGDGHFGFDVAIISVRHSACVLVVLVESAAPQMVQAQSNKNDHLEMISLLSAGLAPGVENANVAAIVEVTQVGLGAEKNTWATNGPRVSHQHFYRFFGLPAIKHEFTGHLSAQPI